MSGGASMIDMASQFTSRITPTPSGMAGTRPPGSVWRKTIGLLATLSVALVVLTSALPAAAWQHGRMFVSPGSYVGYPWAPPQWAPIPHVRALPGYRFAYPPGTPLAYSDPGSGTTYCLSQPTGYYYECGYSPSAPSYSDVPFPPMPPMGGPPTPDQMASPASGVLIFRLPQGSEVAVDSVPIGLSEGLGILSVTPGRHQVILRVAGKDTEHTVSVGAHKILTITPTSIVATEP